MKFKIILNILALVSFALIISSTANAKDWNIVSEGSSIDFIVKEMGVPIPGEFKKFRGTISINLDKPEKSIVQLNIDSSSLTTDNPEADAIAVDADWMDKLHFPEATFKSLSAKQINVDHFEIEGKLYIKGIEKILRIPFTIAVQSDNKIIVDCQFSLNRSEFKIGGGVWNQGGIVAESIPVKVKLLLQEKQSLTSKK